MAISLVDIVRERRRHPRRRCTTRRRTGQGLPSDDTPGGEPGRCVVEEESPRSDSLHTHTAERVQLGCQVSSGGTVMEMRAGAGNDRPVGLLPRAGTPVCPPRRRARGPCGQCRPCLSRPRPESPAGGDGQHRVPTATAGRATAARPRPRRSARSTEHPHRCRQSRKLPGAQRRWFQFAGAAQLAPAVRSAATPPTCGEGSEGGPPAREPPDAASAVA